MNRQCRRSSDGSSNSNSSTVPQLSPTRARAPALAPASAVPVTHDGGGASSPNNGLRNGACGLGGSVSAPLASFGNGDGRGGSIGAPPATREDLAPSPTTPASAPASSASVPRDGGGASSATNGLRNDACGHGGSVGAPLVLAGNGGGHGGSTGASLATCGDSAPAPTTSAPTPASAASGIRDGSGASSATHGRRNGAGGHGCSVVAPLVASSGNGGGHGGAIGAPLATRRDPAPSPTAPTSPTPVLASVVLEMRDGSGASSATHGRRNGAGGHGCSIIAPLVASSGNGGGHGGAIGALLATRRDPAPSPTAPTSPTPVLASVVLGMRDGSGASSTTQGRRNGAGGHGCSVVAPLVVSSGNGGDHGESFSAPFATCGDPAPSPTAPTSPTPVLVRKIRPMYGVLNEDGSRPTHHEDGSTLTYWEMRDQFTVLAASDDGTTMTCDELRKQIAGLVQPTPHEERPVNVAYESDLWRTIRAQGYMCYTHSCNMASSTRRIAATNAMRTTPRPPTTAICGGSASMHLWKRVVSSRWALPLPPHQRLLHRRRRLLHKHAPPGPPVPVPVPAAEPVSM